MPVDQAKDKSSLLRRMASESDIVLTFDSDRKLNAHAAILRLHSPVLTHKLQISNSSSKKRKCISLGSTNTGAGLKLLHMPGTSKADFEVLAQFL
jgi:lipopolysaccharide biosynthesis protein